MSKLSYKQKKEWFQFIIQRDGYRCLYCKKQLAPRTLIYEHLSGDDSDNSPDNLAFSCQSGKRKKTKNDTRIQTLADYKHEDNLKKYVGEKFPQLDVQEEEHESSKEIDINKKSWTITEEFLRNYLMMQKK